ncbi:MAG: HlyD family efflux transporter periplasmic adaptor subunit [Candidatus Latescibacteria bacterium]|nr:HlyD family efflux transporter periplasmic adaptor subunit [Candidatus Latescibacterota bacterium]
MKYLSGVQETSERPGRRDVVKFQGLVSGLILTTVLCIQSGCDGYDSQFARVEQGRFRSTLTETGELQAVSYTIIPMPHFNWQYGRPKIATLEPEGTVVSKGEVVGTIETSGVVKEIGRKKADLAIARAILKNMRVQHASKLKQLEGDIRSAESSLRVAEIDEQRVSFESKTQKKLKALDTAIKTLALKRLHKRLETVSVVQAEEVRIHRAVIRKIESSIAMARRTLETFVLRAPAHGLIEYRQNRLTGRKVSVGDQLWPGTPILGLPNLSRMKAKTWVSETDINKIALDQQIRLRLDAFPKFVFSGHVTEVSRIGRRKNRNDRSKVFDVELLLDVADPLLRPGMTVSCEFLVAYLEDALFVPSDCIHQDKGEFVLYVKQTWGLKRVPVSLGPRSNRTVVVSGDVLEGDQVAKAVRMGSI